MSLIQLGAQTFIASDSKIISANFSPYYPKGVGSLYIHFTVPATKDKEHVISLMDKEDHQTALKILRKMAAQVVNTTPEIDFWVDVVNRR
jgi:L-rhamnose isomerase